MGSAQSVQSPSHVEKENAKTISTKSTAGQERKLERSGTVAVASTFKHEFSHEMSPDELRLVRRLVKLTSTTPTDEPGEYANPLYPNNASGEAIQIAEEIMAKTRYAFNFVHHGQHDSDNIKSLLEQHSNGSGGAVPRTDTTQLHFKKADEKVVDKKLEARKGVTALDLAAELRAKSKKASKKLPSLDETPTSPEAKVKSGSAATSPTKEAHATPSPKKDDEKKETAPVNSSENAAKK